MSDLIRREDVLEALLGWGTDPTDGEIEYTVNSIPAAEPKMGRWVEVTNGRGGHECSECHEYAPSYQDRSEYLSDYCPNCGVKMERSK